MTIPVAGPEHVTHFATPRFGESAADTSVGEVESGATDT